MKLSDAVKVYAGAVEAAKVMLGSAEAYSSAPASKSDTFLIAAGGDDGRSYNNSGTFSSSETNMYMGRNTTSPSYYPFFRFSGVNIKKGSTINSAHINLRSAGTAVLDLNVTYKGVDEDDASAPTSKTEFDEKTMATATVAQTISSWPDAGSWFKSPDIKSIIEEIVGRDGYAEDHLEIFIMTDGAYNKNVDMYTYEWGASYAATLDVEWTEP